MRSGSVTTLTAINDSRWTGEMMALYEYRFLAVKIQPEMRGAMKSLLMIALMLSLALLANVAKSREAEAALFSHFRTEPGLKCCSRRHCWCNPAGKDCPVLSSRPAGTCRYRGAR
jgi:hypothetical protein